MTGEIRGDGRNARRNRSRERILQAAFLLVERGNWRPSVKDIAKQAGVSVRTIFDIFGTLDDVYEAVLASYGPHLRSLVGAVINGNTPNGLLRIILMGRLPATEQSQQEPV